MPLYFLRPRMLIMSSEAWTAVGIFIASQLLIWIVTMTSIRSDAKHLKSELNSIKDDMKEIAKVVTVQAVQAQMIQGQNDKIVTIDRRVQEMETRFNKYVDAKILPQDLI
jgi:hypothetical protein